MQPKLPIAQHLLPYLNRIDESRIYSNFGPLVIQLEERLAEHYGVSPGTAVTVANATLGLALALLAQNPRAGALCVVPAWTFIASPQAAQIAGLTPYFVDVDPTTWALAPDEIDDIVEHAPGEVGAVMPVVPFGQPIDFVAWDSFRRRTGLPVVIDAAAGFDSLAPTSTPAVVSLHATKAMGIGEGGFVVSTDKSLVADVRARANFGFAGTRDGIVPALNAKLSEYHAAVGNAGLDEWDKARAEWLAAGAAYRRRLPESCGIRLQPGFGQSWVSSVCVLGLGSPNALRVEHRMQTAGIETRRWWGAGAHTHPSTAALPRTALPETDALALSTIAVPLYRDISKAEIDRVAACLLESDSR